MAAVYERNGYVCSARVAAVQLCMTQTSVEISATQSLRCGECSTKDQGPEHTRTQSGGRLSQSVWSVRGLETADGTRFALVFKIRLPTCSFEATRSAFTRPSRWDIHAHARHRTRTTDQLEAHSPRGSAAGRPSGERAAHPAAPRFPLADLSVKRAWRQGQWIGCGMIFREDLFPFS